MIEFEKSLNYVYKKLSKLSKEELRKELDKHKNGDFAKIILINPEVINSGKRMGK